MLLMKSVSLACSRNGRGGNQLTSRVLPTVATHRSGAPFASSKSMSKPAALRQAHLCPSQPQKRGGGKYTDYGLSEYSQ